MSKNSRRSFLTGAAVAAASGSSILSLAQGAEAIPGFDQTKTDQDKTSVWEPFSERKVRVGLVGHDFIDAILRERKPKVDVIDALNMTVPGYYAHLSAMKDGETMKIPQYSL